MSHVSFQEILAFAAVALAATFLSLRFFRRYLAEPLSRYLLRKNRVRAAYWAKAQAASGCDDCSGCGDQAAK